MNFHTRCRTDGRFNLALGDDGLLGSHLLREGDGHEPERGKGDYECPHVFLLYLRGSLDFYSMQLSRRVPEAL